MWDQRDATSLWSNNICFKIKRDTKTDYEMWEQRDERVFKTAAFYFFSLYFSDTLSASSGLSSLLHGNHFTALHTTTLHFTHTYIHSHIPST